MLSKTTGAGLLAALGAAALLGAAAGPASAADTEMALPTTHLAPTDASQALGGLGYAVAPVKNLRLDPWAKSGFDLLNNGAELLPDQGLPKVGTGVVTKPLSDGGGAGKLPVAGTVLGALPG